ncbi:hypothetical protein A2G06_16625 (plasmid) [Geobacter anodireducens]|nr:hypothetical protein A2G06_16625 [Geobacter anodireducens]
MAEGQAAGTAAGESVRGLFGSKDGFNSNISKPLTNTDTPLKTVDGTTAFSASLAMPSTSRFLELMIQPGGTGDLQVATFSTDLDMDGNFDYVYQVPRPVSGACGNGYISCNPGSWSNCKPYKWVADQNGHLSDMNVSITELGGCYCINSSCGSSLVWNNASIVLKDLAGGAVAAIQKANIGFMVTNVSVTPVSISYYGRLTDSVNVASTSSTSTLPPPAQTKSYFTNPGDLSVTVNNLVTTSGSDPNSLYSLLSNSLSMKDSAVVQKTCAITRSGGIVSEKQSDTLNGTDSTATDHLIYIRISKVDDYTLNLETIDTGPGGYPAAAHSNNCDGVSSGWKLFKTITLPVSANQNSKLTKATWSLPSMWGGGCSSGSGFVDGVLNGFGTPIQTTITCGAKGCQGVGFDWTFYYEYTTDTYSESVSDQCQALANDTTCRLKEEVVDNVTITQNFNSTGLNPLPSCRDFAGETATMNICRPWWLKKRTYVCENATPWDFSDIGKRFGMVTKSIQQNGTSITFNDTTKGKDGTWTDNNNIDITLISVPAGEACEKACKTRIPKEDNEVTVDGLGSSIRANNANANDFLYKLCVNNVCPVDQPGEVIVSDCQCGSSFAEAAAAIQAMRLAGKDTICTSGTPKPLQ